MVWVAASDLIDGVLRLLQALDHYVYAEVSTTFSKWRRHFLQWLFFSELGRRGRTFASRRVLTLVLRRWRVLMQPVAKEVLQVMAIPAAPFL